MDAHQPSPKPPHSSPPEVKIHGPGAKVMAAIGVALSALYLFNPTMGIFELIPDNLPVVGNLDEAAVTGILLYCLSILGLKLPFGRPPPQRQDDEQGMREVGPKGR